MVDLQKIEDVRNWTRPTAMIEIHSFMGLARYYHWFMKGFAFITLYITCLTLEEVPFICTDEYEERF